MLDVKKGKIASIRAKLADQSKYLSELENALDRLQQENEKLRGENLLLTQKYTSALFRLNNNK